MKVYRVEFEGVYPVGNCLIIAARTNRGARKIAESVIKHTHVESVTEVKLDVPKVIEYLSGDY